MTRIREPDANRVFEHSAELLAYTNRRHKIADDITEAADIRRVSPHRVLQVREALYDAPGLIRGYVWENPTDLSLEDRKLVASWRAFERGRFLVRRFTSEYAEFFPMTSRHRLFAVNSLHESFKQMGVDPPQIVSGVLLPYGDRIVSDGLLRADAFVGDTMSRDFDEDIDLARARYGLINRLPAPREPTHPDFRDENGNPPITDRQRLDEFYRAAIHGDVGGAYRLIAQYEQALRAGHVDPSTTDFESYYYDRVTTGIDTVALTEGWSFLAELMEAYDPAEEDTSPTAAAVGNAVALYVVRIRQTATVDEIPTAAIEYLLVCANASPETKAWTESTAIGWGIDHPDVRLTKILRDALRDGRTRWANEVLHNAFYADQQAAANLLADLASEGALPATAVEFIDELSLPNAWPGGPTGSWWEEFGYTFEWDDANKTRVHNLKE